MKSEDRQRVQIFLNKWKGSQGNERANYQSFFSELCDALAVDRPPPKGNLPGDPYCFDKDIKIFYKDGQTTNFSDFYKEGHFLIEAKQGGNTAKRGTAKRGTKTYDVAMEKAFYQAQSCTPFLSTKPPFLITCDIGSHFELWVSFGGNYGGYGAREIITLERLLEEKVFNRFVAIFNDPQSLNPDKYRARVTREVADTLAKLARQLEKKEHDESEAKLAQNLEEKEYESDAVANKVAKFLMCCIFTMFAENVNLLKGNVFTKLLKESWIPQVDNFKPEIENLWKLMDKGGTYIHRIPQFNGSFFKDAIAFKLDEEQLKLLEEAANKDWTEVEPAIFGTLLERALDTKERSKLGAHYTPRSYVERLVRPVVIEPLREKWLLVETEVHRLLMLTEERQEPTKMQKQNAEKLINKYLKDLRDIRILDPACGSGNFLYVTLDLMKTLEMEALQRLADISGTDAGQLMLDMKEVQVYPSQFLGIEINPRAKQIAELVIWIGYLQWQFKQRKGVNLEEPILQDLGNIKCRDALFDYDGEELDIDPQTGKVKTRWGGKMIKHPVTGEDVPDPSDKIRIYRYINPRPAKWPDADYIVSNPPFIGDKKMRNVLGDEYVTTLRNVYKQTQNKSKIVKNEENDGEKDVPETSDLVMFWWHIAGQLLVQGKIQSFGFITTNTITQIFNRKVLDNYLNKISLSFAIRDHPWLDTTEGSSVRIAMTVAILGQQEGSLATVTKETETEEGYRNLDFQLTKGLIRSDLRIGADILSTSTLFANSEISNKGVTILGEGFFLSEQELHELISREPQAQSVIRLLYKGKDITDSPRGLKVIDLYGLTEQQVQQHYPHIYQRIKDRVFPVRAVQKRKAYRDNWWVFAEPRSYLRNALEGLERYIATVETAKHRVFSFLNSNILPDVKLAIVASNDAYHLAILSSNIHIVWSLIAGGTLENRPVYSKSTCFDPFPFPDPTPEQKHKIRELGERLDFHRKRVQTQHPEITITGMYNLLEKLRKGETFTEADKAYNNKALVSTLKQIYDELDNAVLDAYGWQDLKDDNKTKAEFEEIILKRLVALNAERAEEERNGIIRWLRPEYQAPNEVTQQMLTEVMEAEETVTITTQQKTFPKQPKDQLAAIRDLLRHSNSEWTIEQIAAQFKNGGRYKNAIIENLERLEWFGILLCRETEQTQRWQYVEMHQMN